jgi:hypothetical protein
MDCICPAQNSERALVKAAMNILIPKSAVKFSIGCRTGSAQLQTVI